MLFYQTNTNIYSVNLIYRKNKNKNKFNKSLLYFEFDSYQKY